MPSEDLKQVSFTELPRVAQVLADAFYEDPVARFVYPDDEGRVAWLTAAFEVQARLGLIYGRVYATDDYGGVAVWLTPSSGRLSLWSFIRAGGLRLLLRSSVDVLNRVRRLPGTAQKLHRQCVSQRHWYLLLLAVKPERQGQGIGTRLLQPVLKTADGDSVPCYLETANERTIAFYERHGFSICSEGDIAGGPHLWGMLRRSGSASSAHTATPSTSSGHKARFESEQDRRQMDVLRKDGWPDHLPARSGPGRSRSAS